MTTTGLSRFDTTVQKSQMWVNDVATILKWENQDSAFQALRVVLHHLRDRLTVEEAAHLGAQLPVLLAGFYYEDWKPASNPTAVESQEEFLGRVNSDLEKSEPNFSAERVVRAVFSVLAGKVSAGEVEEVVHMLPDDLKQLWPQPVRA